MEELRTQLESHAATWSGEKPETDPMTLAAQKWASHCLETYVGEHLRTGIAVAVALSEFATEFYQSEKKGASDAN